MHAAQEPQLSANDPIILSDTHGYDFTQYLNQLTQRVRTKWYSSIPDVARQGQKGRVVVIFTIPRDGGVQNVRIVAGSGTESLDRAATNAVQSVSPVQMLPADFNDNQIVVQFAFSYNQR
jgi:TonB family protein